MRLSMTLGRASDGIAIDDVVLVPNHWWERLLIRLHLLRIDQQLIGFVGLMEPTDDWYSLKIYTKGGSLLISSTAEYGIRS